MVLESIPIGVAKTITEAVKATTLGCGAGLYVDGQNLNAFTKETRSGAYPTPEHGFTGAEKMIRLFPS